MRTKEKYLVLLAGVLFTADLAIGGDGTATVDSEPNEEIIDRISRNEIQSFQQFRANIEVYIQEFDADGIVRNDHYWLGEARTQRGRLSTSEFATRPTRSRPQPKSEIVPAGFATLLFPDPAGFDIDHFDWKYRGRELLGTVATLIFDLRPKPIAGNGSFIGRVWVAPPPDLQILRFDGTFTGPPRKKTSPYLHFVGVRNRVTLRDVGLWIPAAVYIDERDLGKPVAGIAELRARVNVWRMHKQAETTTSSGTLAAEGDGGSEKTPTLSRLREPAVVYAETERKILDWLQAAGLIAPPSDVDRMVEGIIYKLIRNAPINSSGQIHCRTLLSLPLEWFVVGRTLVISKSIVDTATDESALAAVLAPAAASLLQNRPIQPISEAFLQNRDQALKKFSFELSKKDIAEAEKDALKLLQLSEFLPALANAAVFQRIAEKYCAQLPAAFTPRFGNKLSVCEQGSLLRQLDPYAPRKSKGPGALPLNARLSINGWTDEIQMLDPPEDNAPFLLLPIELSPRLMGKVAEERPAVIFPPPGPNQRAPAKTPLKGAALKLAKSPL